MVSLMHIRLSRVPSDNAVGVNTSKVLYGDHPLSGIFTGGWIPLAGCGEVTRETASLTFGAGDHPAGVAQCDVARLHNNSRTRARELEQTWSRNAPNTNCDMVPQPKVERSVLGISSLLSFIL